MRKIIIARIGTLTAPCGYGAIVIVKVFEVNARGNPVSHPFMKKIFPVSRICPARAPGDISEG
jgi:hypothetical protein